MKLRIQPFVAPGFGQNSYIVWRDGERRAVCIDAGNAVPAMLRLLEEEALTLEAILLTHAHIDHIDGAARLVAATDAPIHLHPDDRVLYDHVGMQAQQFGLDVDEPPAPGHDLHHGQRLDIAGIGLDVRHVPGHAPGHVMFVAYDDGCAFVGDVVFQGSIGRSDLFGGDYAQLISSIRDHVLTLPDETVLYTGHGPHTTVGHERTTNPFLIPHYGGGLA